MKPSNPITYLLYAIHPNKVAELPQNNSTRNNSANIANEKAFVNRTKEKRLGNNIVVDPHTEKRRWFHIDRSGDISNFVY